MKQRINWIWKRDLDSYFEAAEKVKSKDGDYVLVPETLEIYVVPTKLERIQVEINRLEKELEGMKEPTKEELVEAGKVHHEYYMILERLNYYKDELK